MANKKMDLDRPYTVNGRTYNAGSQVEVDSDHAQAINDMKENGDAQHAYETAHHGVVPMHNDPQEATAQTPTRPLAAPVVVQEAKAAPVTPEGPVTEVKDPSADGKGRSADESNKDVLEDPSANTKQDSGPDQKQSK